MEILGVRLNVERLAEVAGRVRAEAAELEREIFRLAGEEFVIASPQQLGEVLFGKLGLSRKRRGKTGFSTDARVLQAIRTEHEVVPLIERWRELSTLIKTYLDVLPGLVDARSRIHTTFLQAVATTGRLSSTNPNLQNVPIRTSLGREIRGCFEADEGNVLIAADYSQIELRVLANVAEEPALMEIFERGEDVHTATASRVFGVGPDEIDPGMRSKSKMINYGIVYGLSDFGLADRLNIPREEAKEFIDAYLERFPRVAAFIAETVERAREDGYVTTAPVGSFPANEFGLYEMAGNVWEWANDAWYPNQPYDASKHENDADTWRVLRGGSWRSPPGNVRAACRIGMKWDVGDRAVGFRLARSERAGTE